MTEGPDRTEVDDHAPAQREPRQSVLLSATLECFGRPGATKHRVRDLSPQGMRIEQAAGLQVGATVLVAVGQLEAVGAAIVWIKKAPRA
ncbi:PilZ domain-containing protein [Sphingomonas faeni]|uniref:PilZ domain-containing protein n=1 Tax=Sphingomonas faeni TaxID=185950 RepID=UPI003CC5F3F7